MSQQSDQQLLRQYVRQRSQPAFAALTARYASLVYSICLRELHSTALAEDAAQNVFLLLAQRAPALQHTNALAGWLFTASRLISQNLRREEQRRQRREERVMQDWVLSAASPDPQSAYEYDAAWGELEPHLHDALARLNPNDRALVLLRFGEERTLAQSGAILGISENTARMRVNRALDKLRRHLAQAGVTLSVAALATLLTQKAAPAAPATLVQSLAQFRPLAATTAAGGSIAAVSGLSSWAKGVVALMAAGSAKIFTGAGLALVLALCGWQGAKVYSTRHTAWSKAEMFRLEMLLLKSSVAASKPRPITPDELAQVRNLLPQLDSEHRSMLIGILGATTKYHPNGPIVRATLLEYTHDPYDDVRNSAAGEVAVCSRGNTGVLQRLQQMRDDPSPLVRRNWPGYMRLYTGEDVPDW